MSRTYAIVEITPCPMGYDESRCYDESGLNGPCGGDENKHCIRGQAQVMEFPNEIVFDDSITDMLLDYIECPCGPDEWVGFAVVGDPYGGVGISVTVCPKCAERKKAAITLGWGTCELRNNNP